VKKTRRSFELGRLEVKAAQFGPDGAAGKSTTMRAEPGEIVVIVGPTGSGKTTFLRGLLGLLPLSAGRIVYDGQDLSGAGVGPSERPFAWVPQEPAIVPGTIEENVALGAAELAPAQVEAALARVGGLELAKARREAALSAGGHELSGGERQIVALARALASEQPVLLLDEPTSGLDPDAEVRVLDALEKQRGARTILLVTHRPAPLAIADRVVSFGVLPGELGELAGKNANAGGEAEEAALAQN
jgi:ABC-type transport system involved in cytochrome bd biosynthesis fused ATPase/permease subunit